MRVELIYNPGCQTYKKILDKLETIIAEERLPLPVHLIESNSLGQGHLTSPSILIDGHDIHELSVTPQGDLCRLYPGQNGVSSMPLDILRDVLWRKWKEWSGAAGS